MLGLLLKHLFTKTFYYESVAVLPEYQNRGIGTALTEALISEAKRSGYRFLVSHAKEDPSLEIHKKFGASVIRPYENWFNTGYTHYLCEIDLEEIPLKLNLAPVKQSKDYTCGPASLKAVLSYYRIETDEETLERLSGCTKESGTSHTGLIKVIENLGLKQESKYNASIDDIIKKINEGLPVIVHYFLPERNDEHYSVVLGYNKANLFILNVLYGKEIKYSKAEFEKNWFCKLYEDKGKRWMMAVSNKPSLTYPG